MGRKGSKFSRTRTSARTGVSTGSSQIGVDHQGDDATLVPSEVGGVADHDAASQLAFGTGQQFVTDTKTLAAQSIASAWVRALTQIARLPFFADWELTFFSTLKSVILKKGNISEIEAKAVIYLLRAHGMIARFGDGLVPTITLESAFSPEEDDKNRASALSAFQSLAQRLPWAAVTQVASNSVAAGVVRPEAVETSNTSRPQTADPVEYVTVPTGQADAQTFWDGVAVAFGHWAKSNLPSLIDDKIASAGSDEVATALLLEAFKGGLAELVDSEAATRMRQQLIELRGPTAFLVCNLSDLRVYLLVLENDYQFIMSSQITLKAILIEGIRERLGQLDEARLRAIYALAADPPIATEPQKAQPGPETVPEAIAQFTSRPKGETAPAFIKRVYAQWLGEISRQDLRRLNEPAYRGLYAYESKLGRRISKEHEGFELPTRSEVLDDELAKAGSLEPGEDERRRRRLTEAAQRRQRHSQARHLKK